MRCCGFVWVTLYLKKKDVNQFLLVQARRPLATVEAFLCVRLPSFYQFCFLVANPIQFLAAAIAVFLSMGISHRGQL